MKHLHTARWQQAPDRFQGLQQSPLGQVPAHHQHFLFRQTSTPESQ